MFRRIAAVVGGVTLFAVIGAGTASAESGHKAKNVSGGPPPGAACSTDGWAQGCFVADGDRIWVKDAREDGHHAAVFFWWSGQASKPELSCHDHHGKAAGWTVCDDLAGVIPEHKTLTFWPVTMEGDRIISGGASPQVITPTS
ncbi:hypothetical protein [Streptomyces sp. MNP-20]|uniref:hypothetical protein n=1 Tax=Streptomyces sp. MNP-20 TaxID=2721165 RepID=UPI001556E763|nr:hypothetical protein [Streptomyces sp. MNP-20]